MHHPSISEVETGGGGGRAVHRPATCQLRCPRRTMTAQNAFLPLPAQHFSTTPPFDMAKALTKSQIVTTLAETVGVTKKQAAEALEALVALAYKNAKNSFTIPGLGKLVLVNRKARMGRNPATGQSIKIPAKRVVKFRIAKAAKEAILDSK